MKKIILSSVLFLSQLATAQFLVWENSFETPGDLQGWAFHDLNNNGNGWVQGKNIYFNGTSLTYGTSGVLRHSMSLVPSGPVPNFATENDWVISPQIDLTTASGEITLAVYFGRQRTTHTIGGRDFYIYTSTPQKEVPELSDFQSMALDASGNYLGSPYHVYGGYADNPFPADLTQFIEGRVDLSSFAGKKIYIGMWANRYGSGNNVQNINIDEMAIYATASTLGTKEAAKKGSLTRIAENPVKDILYLQLDPSLKESKVMVNIYGMTGQKMLSIPYSNAINVTGLETGNYIAEIAYGNSTERLKFIKK